MENNNFDPMNENEPSKNSYNQMNSTNETSKNLTHNFRNFYTKNKKMTWIIVIIFCVLLLAGAGVLIWYFTGHVKNFKLLADLTVDDLQDQSEVFALRLPTKFTSNAISQKLEPFAKFGWKLANDQDVAQAGNRLSNGKLGAQYCHFGFIKDQNSNNYLAAYPMQWNHWSYGCTEKGGNTSEHKKQTIIVTPSAINSGSLDTLLIYGKKPKEGVIRDCKFNDADNDLTQACIYPFYLPTIGPPFYYSTTTQNNVPVQSLSSVPKSSAVVWTENDTEVQRWSQYS